MARKPPANVEETGLEYMFEVVSSNLDTYVKTNVNLSWYHSYKREEIEETSIVTFIDNAFAFKLPSLSTDLT